MAPVCAVHLIALENLHIPSSYCHHNVLALLELDQAPVVGQRMRGARKLQSPEKFFASLLLVYSRSRVELSQKIKSLASMTHRLVVPEPRLLKALRLPMEDHIPLLI